MSLPEDCSLLEKAKSDEERARWISLIPMFLSDLDGKHPTVLNQPDPGPGQLPPFLRRYYEPNFQPLRQLWSEYTRLCEKHTGLEKRFCAPRTKYWSGLSSLLPDAEIMYEGKIFSLPWLAIGFDTIPLAESGEVGFHAPGIVFEVASYLKAVSVDDLNESFGEDPDPYGLLTDLVLYFKELQVFYDAAAEHGEIVLVDRDG